MSSITRSIVGAIRKPLLIAAAFALVAAPMVYAEPVNPLTQIAQPVNPLTQVAGAVNPLSQVAEPVNPLAQQDQPANPAPQQPQPVNPLAQQNQTAPSGRMTIEQLGQALNEYGKNTITNNEETYYKLHIVRGEWTFGMNVSLSPNGKFIWITAPLTNIPDLDKASVAALANLLQQNADLGPTFFQMVGPKHQISLTRPIPNTGMTPELVRAYVEDMMKVLVKTEPLWKAETLTPSHGTPEAVTNPLANR